MVYNISLNGGRTMSIGILFGRYLPPHRGHMYHIAMASTKVDELHVFILEDKQRDYLACSNNHVVYIDGKLRLRWMCEQLQDISHIKIHLLESIDGNDLPLVESEVRKILPNIDVMFVKKQKDLERYESIFLDSERCVLPDRSVRFPICSSDILHNPLTHWEYILGSSRPHFVKKILVTGTESCGKTTLIKSLGKLYNTSWCEEVGRFYPDRYTGGNEEVYNTLDFSRMGWQHKEREWEVCRSANRLAFIDTDAVVTQYYSELYLHEHNEVLESIISINHYDLILMLSPDVKWVSDGKRLNSDQQKREKLHKKLLNMYEERGFKVEVIHGNYEQRLQKAISLIDDLLSKY